MASTIDPRVLKGFRDFLPSQEIERKRIQAILEKTFTSFGFVPIDTPVLEYTEVLLGKGGGETDKQIYRFEDNGGRDVSMRFDLTVPFARYMAAHRNELYLPFKRFHIGKVYRGENTQRGRYREFTQCDFDIIGTDSSSSDLEILILMHDALAAFGVDEVTIMVAHRGIFNDFLQTINADHKLVEILRTVDKLKRIGTENVRKQLLEFLGQNQADSLLEFIQPASSFSETLEKAEKLVGESTPSIERLKEVYAGLCDVGLAQKFSYDPSITRGLDYYTGIVFETFLDALPAIGSVCSGGRYDNLASLYTKEHIPGVGSSIGLDRLLAALEELNQHRQKASAIEVLIFCLDQKLNGLYHRIARSLRNENINCEVFPETKKLGQQFGFAEKKNIPLGVIIGEEEAKAGVTSLKDLNSRENFNNLNEKELIIKIQELLDKGR